MKYLVRGVIGLAIILLVSLIAIWLYHPYSYKTNKAIENGDIVMAADGLHNTELFYELLEAIDNKESYHPIRITCFSKEGFPTIFDINYDGNIISCVTDNTRNLFGRDYKKEYGEYTRYEIRINNDYFLIDDNGNYDDRCIIQTDE